MPVVEDLTEDDPVSNFLDIVKIEQPDTPEVSDHNDYDSDQNPSASSSRKRTRDTETVDEEEDNKSVVSEDKNQANTSVTLTTQEMAEWSDVVKMGDYLTRGRRPQFWEEAFTRRVLDAIKNKSLEMKKAAIILGVSYGTLYGRYREVYGCLKHPFRGPPYPKGMANMWKLDQNSSDLMNLLQQNAMTIGTSGNNMQQTQQRNAMADPVDWQQQLRNQGVTLISE